MCVSGATIEMESTVLKQNIISKGKSQCKKPTATRTEWNLIRSEEVLFGIVETQSASQAQDILVESIT